MRDGFLVPPKSVSVPLRFQREEIKYDDLSEEEKDQWDALEWDEDGDPPDRVGAEAVNKWLFNQDTVDKVLEHVMTHGLKVAGGDRLGKTIIIAKNNDHAEFIAAGFNANYPHYKGEFARVITFKTEYAPSLIESFSQKDKLVSRRNRKIFNGRQKRLRVLVCSFDHLICFIQAKPDSITHIGKGHPTKGKNSAGSGLRTLRVSEISELNVPIDATRVLAHLGNRVRRFAELAFANGGMVGGATFENVVDAIRMLSPEAAGLLSSFSSERRARIAAISPKVRGVLAAQKDTVAVALNIAHINRDELLEWDPLTKDAGRPPSFLAGLPSVRLREDQMIVQDLRKFPEFEEVWSGPHNATTFEGRNCTLTVIMTNRLPLEEVTGASAIPRIQLS